MDDVLKSLKLNRFGLTLCSLYLVLCAGLIFLAIVSNPYWYLAINFLSVPTLLLEGRFLNFGVWTFLLNVLPNGSALIFINIFLHIVLNVVILYLFGCFLTFGARRLWKA